MSKNKIKNYKKGLWAEFVTRLYFYLLGYKVLEKRYKTKMGEIDLICIKGKCLVFVEVKTRKTHDVSMWSVTERNKSRIVNAAKLYIGRYKGIVDGIRFDVVSVKAYIIIKHIKNAFSA